MTAFGFGDETMLQLAQAYRRLDEMDDDVRGALDSCMNGVNERARRLLELRYTRDLKPAAIARKLGVTPNAVSAALYRIRHGLEQCIRRRLEASS